MDDISADYSAFNVGNSAAQTDQIAIATGVKSIWHRSTIGQIGDRYLSLQKPTIRM